MERLRSRLAGFKEVLSASVIDLKKLRKLCLQGCPDEEGIRATCWKVLLGYLPLNTKEWEGFLKGQRELYVQLMSEAIVDPHAGEDDSRPPDDHPLSLSPTSNWHRYFKDNSVLLQIDSDSRRLYPDISFFQLPTNYPRAAYNASMEALKERVDKSALPSQKVSMSKDGMKNLSLHPRTESEPYSSLKQGEEAHWEVVERILFIHAKVYSGISYVQGMNEILGPIYYVFAQNPNKSWREHAEADAFFCFAKLMAEIGDNYTRKLDFSKVGIGAAMDKMMHLLERKDKKLHKNLVQKGVEPTYFSFRWLTLLLSQEFLLPDVIHLWDWLFTSSQKMDYLIYFSCAMLVCARSELIEGDFSECIKLLQNYPVAHADISKLLGVAEDIKKFYPL